MKVIKDFRREMPSNSSCHSCKLIDYVVYTPMGANYITCPVCKGSADFYDDTDETLYTKYENVVDKYENNTRSKNNGKRVYDTKNLYEWNYCNKCHILFNYEIHGVNGCTDSSYTAIFISKFKWNGEIYKGMPQLDNDEIFEVFKINTKTPIFEILDIVSTNTDPVPLRYCKKAYYPYYINSNSTFYHGKDIERFGKI